MFRDNGADAPIQSSLDGEPGRVFPEGSARECRDFRFTAEEAEPFPDLARRRGMLVTANLMKSYALPPKQFARPVKHSESLGADVVYIVDSAGTMLPGEAVEYYRAVREVI